MKYIFASTIAIAAVLGTAAQADTQAQSTPSLAAGAGAAPAGALTLGAPFQVNINSDDQTATISDTFSFFGKKPIKNDDGSYSGRSDHLTVTIVTPLAQNGDFTNTTSLDGLTKATSVAFSYGYVAGGFKLGNLNDPQHLTLDPSGTWVASLNGKVGTEHHEYYDPTTLVQHTSDTTPWQVGGALGYIFEDGDKSLNLSFNYQESFQDGDTGAARTLCLTTDNCVTGFIGAPVLMHKGLVTGDFRWIGSFASHPLGIDVSATYDPINDAESVQIPIYLMADSSGNLTGGVRYNWNSDTHQSIIGVFASTGFSVFSQ